MPEAADRPEPASAYDRLTPKQQKWVTAYLGEARRNASKAARLAGYSERSAADIGHELRRKPEIRAAIDEILQAEVSSRWEVLHRVDERARSRHTEFIRDDGTVDIKGLKAAGLGHLIKGTKYDARGNLVVMWYSADAADELLGKYYGLWSDKSDGGDASGPEPEVREIVVMKQPVSPHDSDTE